VVAWASGPDLDRAYKLYHLTEFQQSLDLLRALPNKDAAVYELMGRDYYGQGDFKKATEVLEKAAALDPENSEIYLWLGRAFGRRAETSSMLTAPGFATKARQFFEKAAQINPDNLDAQSDLFEYYLEAPGFLGGGIDKAQTIADQMGRISSSNGYFAQARIEERRKQYSAAEAHLRHAIELAPHQVDRLIDLAKFLSKQGRISESDQSLARADQIAPNLPRLMYAKAEMYIQGGRNLDLAKELLQRYLTSSLTPDDPPRSDATKLLRQAQERARNGHGG
jgi:tetratricopeptide (TPR) repeat protein